MLSYLPETLGNELKHTGMASAQNVVSGLTFGLVPQANYGINPNDQYITDGMKKFRSVAQGVAETAASLAIPIGAAGAIGKGLNAATRAVQTANAAGRTAGFVQRAGNWLHKGVRYTDKWLNKPVFRGARTPGYTSQGMVSDLKNIGSQLKHDTWWGRAKTLGGMGRRTAGFFITSGPKYDYQLATAPTVGAAFKNIGLVGTGLTAHGVYSDANRSYAQSKAMRQFNQGNLNPYQMQALEDSLGITQEDMQYLQNWSSKANKAWWENPLLAEAGIDGNMLKKELMDIQ